MPTINVSQKALRLIRALRTSGERDESDTLERILGEAAAARDKAFKDYENADPDIRSTN